MAEQTKKKEQKSERKHSAMKRARQSLKRQLRNRKLTKALRSQIKALRATFGAKDKTKASELLTPTLSTIQKMVTKGILHYKTAARYASRLTKRFNKLA